MMTQKIDGIAGLCSPGVLAVFPLIFGFYSTYPKYYGLKMGQSGPRLKHKRAKITMRESRMFT